MRTTSTRWRLAATLGAAALATTLAVPAAGFAAEDCSPMVIHTPTGSEGDATAVAITSQALEAGSQGWARAGWQAAEGVTITSVTVVRDEGSEHRGGGDLQTGMAEDALELHFCGTTASSEQAPGEKQAGTREPAAAEDRSNADADTEKREKGSAARTEPTTTENGAGHGPSDRGERSGQREPAGRRSDEATTARGAAPDEPAAGGDAAQARKSAEAQGASPADDGHDTAAAATPAAPASVPEGVGGAGEQASGATDAQVLVTTARPTSRPVADEAHRVEQAAISTEVAPASGVEQALLAARSHGPATLVTWGLLGLLAGAVVTTGAHRLQQEVQR